MSNDHINRLIVVTEAVIYLYELQTNRLLTTIDTPPNPHGTHALRYLTCRDCLSNSVQVWWR